MEVSKGEKEEGEKKRKMEKQLASESINTRKKQKDDSIGTIKLTPKGGETLRVLMEKANGSGPRRVLSRDIVEVALRKVSDEDLHYLRSFKATVRDIFKEELKKFQAGDESKTEDMFLAHLLNISENQKLQQQ